MKEVRIYMEGGGRDHKMRVACQEGFHKLLENCGYTGYMPRIVACGSRRDAYDRFRTAHLAGKADFVALLVDSEDPVKANQSAWRHLAGRKDDSMPRPANATEEQVFLMTTSMETWIAADPAALAARYGDKFQASALPSLRHLETRRRDEVLLCLENATRNCGAGYAKGRHSFDLPGRLDPCTLYAALPSFRRMVGILDEKLGCKHTPCPGEEADAASGSA